MCICIYIYIYICHLIGWEHGAAGASSVARNDAAGTGARRNFRHMELRGAAGIKGVQYIQPPYPGIGVKGPTGTHGDP